MRGDHPTLFTTMDRRDPTVRWLLGADNPSARYYTLTELCGVSPRSNEAKKAAEAILRGPQVRALLKGQLSDGGFGVHPYRKWQGAHWRLVSLVELGVPEAFPPAVAAVEQVLAWLESDERSIMTQKINGRWRCHASLEGNALAVCCRLGLATDPRVRRLAGLLRETQWPDGGWNCDPRSHGHHSSFHESLPPLWGLAEYHRATGNRLALAAARRADEFFLRHQLFFSDRTGGVIDRQWLVPHYPPYWHYDIFQALLILSRFEGIDDPRAEAALSIVEQRRGPDSRWRCGPRYWHLARERSTGMVEVVDWGTTGPNKMVTLNALRVLNSAGRLNVT